MEKAFWKQIPDRSLLPLFAGVFFTFSSFGFMLDMRVQGRQTLLELALTVLFSSGFAVVYAWIGTRGRTWWFALAVPVQLAVTSLTRRVFATAPTLAPEAVEQRLMLDLLGATLGIALGFGFFIAFIVTVGSEHIRARTEIALARGLHEDLVPPLSLRAGAWELRGRSEPASEVGGDLVDAVCVGDDVYAVVADVTGHGVRAGTLMGMFKAATRVSLRPEPGLSALLRALNEVMLPLKSPSLFVTAAFLRLRPDGSVEYALAGHPPILHRRARDGTVERLAEGSIPVGLLDGQEFPSSEARLEPGDALALVTDGLIEVEDERGRDLGLAGLESVLARSGEPGEALDGLLRAARTHGEQTDDQSALVVGLVGP